ncbi:MAG: hypothetical protein NG747_13535 [Candidatus Brocadia sp.]|nr:hypothetical protein [Candidatus Brocadia sp.]
MANFDILKTMKLPKGAKAIIPEGKLEDYCLNPFHPDGKHKAKVFEKALGITQTDSTELKKLVLASAVYGEVTKEQLNDFGTTYRVEYETQGVNQREVLCTLWIVHKSDERPYLTSCFVRKRKDKI